MRPDRGSLDLNNLPEEHGKQPVEESSTTTAASSETTRFKKKKKKNKQNGAGKDDSEKVYECRFCSLKFCKSQSLGGHMNRHRRERETETLNRARQLVFSNEALAGAAAMGMRSDLNFGGSQITPGGSGSCLQFRPVYPRLPTQTPPPLLQQNLYPSSSSHSLPYPPSYPHPHPHPHPTMGNYYIGHVVSGSTQRQERHPSFTCYGAPLSHSFLAEGVRAPTARDGVPRHQTDDKNWGL